MTHDRFRVLMVCTGNLCRSPAAERLLRAGLGSAAGARFAITSAGTRGVEGALIHPGTARALEALGLDSLGHAARTLTPRHVLEADLVLTATRAHRALVVELEPRSWRRAFTLAEFARLAPLAAPQAEDPWKLVEGARALRGTVRAAEPHDDDIPDPIAGGPADHVAMVTTVNEAIRIVADSLTRANR